MGSWFPKELLESKNQVLHFFALHQAGHKAVHIMGTQYVWVVAVFLLHGVGVNG